MFKNIFVTLIIIIAISTVSVLVYKHFIPEHGTILRYEEFRGCKVPIKADGKGGTYRWIADVLWDKFTIEEKFDMARVYGGHLSTKDLSEIWFKFGEWRKDGKFYGIRIYKKE